MAEFEVLVREIQPCPGVAHEKETLLQVEAEEPLDYVLANAPYPILDYVEMGDGEVVVTTGDRKGNFVKYSFSR